MRYRLVGIPASFSSDDDILIADESGGHYLLSRDGAYPEPIDARDLPVVLTFYEPVLQMRWTDIGELSVMSFRLDPSAHISTDMLDTAELLCVDP